MPKCSRACVRARVCASAAHISRVSAVSRSPRLQVPMNRYTVKADRLKPLRLPTRRERGGERDPLAQPQKRTDYAYVPVFCVCCQNTLVVRRIQDLCEVRGIEAMAPAHLDYRGRDLQRRCCCSHLFQFETYSPASDESYS